MSMERGIEGQQQHRSMQVMVNPLLLLLDWTPHSERSLAVSLLALSLSLFSSTQNWHTAKSHFRSIPSQFALCGLRFIPLSCHYTIPGFWPAPFVHTPSHNSGTVDFLKQTTFHQMRPATGEDRRQDRRVGIALGRSE